MKKLLYLLMLLLVAASLTGFQVPEEGFTWRGVFEIAILIVVAALGAPVTQFIRKFFGVTEKSALLLTMLVASGIAALELYLTGRLDFAAITVDNFPQAFFGVFSVMTIYYGFLKASTGIFGQGGLLPKIPK